MKPIVAIASMALGAGSMTTALYIALSPNAFMTRTPRLVSDSLPTVHPIVSLQRPALPRVEAPPVAISTVRIVGRAQKNVAIVASDEKTLTPCSDWRSLGPTATRSAGADGVHQVKLLCPAGANAQQTFMANVRRPESLTQKW